MFVQFAASFGRLDKGAIWMVINKYTFVEVVVVAGARP